MSNIYAFNKEGAPAKLFKFLWGVEPHKQFKSMCPYFWAYIVTIAISPLLLIIKLFGKLGEPIKSKLFNIRQTLKENKIKKVIKIINNVITDEDCYNFYHSSYYKTYCKYKYESYELHNAYEIKNIYNRQLNHLDKLLEEDRNKIKFKDTVITTYKESKVIQYIFLGLTSISLIGCLYALIKGVIYGVSLIDWTKALETIITVIEVLFWLTVIGIGIYLFVRLCDYTNNKFKDNGTWNKISKPFKYIGNFFVLIGDTIYNIYKKNCPLITWEE